MELNLKPGFLSSDQVRCKLKYFAHIVYGQVIRDPTRFIKRDETDNFALR